MAPWPQPRLTLTANTDADDDRATTTFTVTHAKDDTTVYVDPGDGSGRTVAVVLSGGTGTSASYRYSDPGHHTYTATVTAPCPPWAVIWGDVPDLAATWADVVTAVETWEDVPRDRETATCPVVVDVGPATIWAAVIDDQPLPYVQISTWIGDYPDVTSWKVTRSCPSAPSVMNVDIHISDYHPGAYSLEDREAPLAQPVTYTLTATMKDGSTITVTSAPVTILGTRGCFLTDTQSGHTIAVTLKSWDERKRAARQSVLDIIGRSVPAVLSDVHLTPSGTWQFLTRTQAELADLIDVLTASRLVLLRTQPASAIETAYAAVGDVTEVRLYATDGAAWERVTSVAVQEVAPIPATAKALHTSWQEVADTWDTWQAVADAQPTWQDLSEWNPAA